MIHRANGTDSYNSHIPISMIKDLGWEKSDKLTLEVGKVRDRDCVIIFREEIKDEI